MSRPADGRPGPPWGRLALATALANLLAGVLLRAAFVSVRKEAVLARQVGALELAALAAVVAIAADLGNVVAGYRAVVAGRRRLRAAPVPDRELVPSTSSALVVLPTGTLVHHRACALVDGKQAEAVAPEIIARRTLRPCPLCTP
jgi:hypothetical protein